MFSLHNFSNLRNFMIFFLFSFFQLKLSLMKILLKTSYLLQNWSTSELDFIESENVQLLAGFEPTVLCPCFCSAATKHFFNELFPLGIQVSYKPLPKITMVLQHLASSRWVEFNIDLSGQRTQTLVFREH